jgi:hypothetical protein
MIGFPGLILAEAIEDTIEGLKNHLQLPKIQLDGIANLSFNLSEFIILFIE